MHEHHPLNVGSSISAVGGQRQRPLLRAQRSDHGWRGLAHGGHRGHDAGGQGHHAGNRAAAARSSCSPSRTASGMLRGSDVYASDGTDAGTTLLGTVDSDGYGPAYPTVVGIEVLLPWRVLGLRERRLALGRHARGHLRLHGRRVRHRPGLPVPVRRSASPSLATRSSSPRSTRMPPATPSRGARAGSTSSTRARPTRRAGPRPRRRSPARRRSGQKLTGDKGAWTLEPNKYAYKWLRNGTPIPNATSTTYTPSTRGCGRPDQLPRHRLRDRRAQRGERRQRPGLRGRGGRDPDHPAAQPANARQARHSQRADRDARRPS